MDVDSAPSAARRRRERPTVADRGGKERVAPQDPSPPLSPPPSSPNRSCSSCRGERIQQHTVELMIEPFVPAPMLNHDAPVPQTVDQFLDMSTPVEQVDVPKIISRTSSRSVPRLVCRSWWNSWWTCQCPTSSRARSRRPRCWHGTGTQMAANRASAVDQAEQGAIGGRQVHDALSTSSRRYSPPAWGGM